ncbi:MAG: deoxyribose-phosphate aldolase [Bacteroidales bacterium]|nr:deoxyribose-phosphate aldolase [Bacteroidales bacterium]
MTDYLSKYGYMPDGEAIDHSLALIASNLDNMMNERVLKECFGCMDLTTLKTNDTAASVEKLVRKVNDFKGSYPEYPLPASVCVFPNFASVVKNLRNNPEVHVTVVSACFPSSQSFPEVKLLECRMAVEAGADEIDIVLALNSFLAGDYARASEEIAAVRRTVDEAAAAQGRKVLLKVILETGLLITPENIANAAFLAMESGADFIKTSTGKVEVNATPMAAYVMCECIACYRKSTGRMVGIKPAGGMSTGKDAACYYSIVASVLGREWLNKRYFRLGVSRMANNILSVVEQKTVAFF